MCGICGLLSHAPREPLPDATRRVDTMLEAMRHRGPDGEHSVTVPHGALGAGRLMIRGLVNGSQPIVDPATGVVAVCNGEIDNHRELRTWLADRGLPVVKDTDVAVIPGLYLELGEDFVDRLQGAFACAVYDPRQGRLILARDRTGERPLFYWLRDGVVGFASELSGLLAIAEPPALCPNSLRDYLRFGFVSAPDTLFRGVRKLRPGESITFDLQTGQTRERRYWRWPVVEQAKGCVSVDEFDAVFREAVRRQSDVDVPYGVFLSGGIDSSLVSSVLRSLRPESSITAYTLRFHEESYDEGDYANRVAALYSFHKRDIWVGPDELRDELERLVQGCGEPLADPAWAPAALCAKAASAEIKLALAGEGADELFAGYPTYLGIGLAKQYARLPGWLHRGVETVVDRWPHSDRKVPISFLVKRFLRGVQEPPLARHRRWTSHTEPDVLDRLLGPEANPADVPPLDGAPLDVIQRYDLENSLADGLLTKADRSGMSTGVEVRAPFLDTLVLDVAARLPAADRVRGLVTKAFLKRYAVRYLPRDIVERRKRGLSVPLAKWLRGPLHDWTHERLTARRLESAGLDRDAALRLFEEHMARRADHTRTIWSLAVLDVWLEVLQQSRDRLNRFAADSATHSAAFTESPHGGESTDTASGAIDPRTDAAI